jgi:hypothetical protein
MRSFSLALLLLTPFHLLRADEPAVEVQPTDPKAAKIVLIAGSNFFKVGEHDYVAAMATLSDLLKQTPGVAPVLAIDWPKNEETFKGAKAVVLMLDGGPKHPLIKDDRFAQLQKMAEAGCGIVQFHQIADYPKDFGDRARGLVGGAFETGYSARAHWVHEFTEFPKHDIFNGVKAFKIDDGWLTKIKFADGMKGVTPLLSTFDPKKKAGEKPEFDVVAWTFEKPQGAGDTKPYRSFTFTGCHLHASFAEEGYRKFLTNAILWSAGVPLPKDGAAVELKKEDVGKYLRKAPEKK